jgi:transcription elongation factor GreA-like protein
MTSSSSAQYQRNIDSLEHDLSLKEREVKDRDEILEFLRSEIRLSDLQDKVRYVDST